MKAGVGKNFVAAALGIVLSLGGLAWVTDRNRNIKDTPVAVADTVGTNTASATNANTQPRPDANYTQSNEAAETQQADRQMTDFDRGYRAGYRDAQQDCAVPSETAVRRVPTRSYARRQVRVAGVRYQNEHRGHSTRNMLLTIGAPAAIGAAIGAIAGGGKGAGIGALAGGGGGAAYYLIRHRRQ